MGDLTRDELARKIAKALIWAVSGDRHPDPEAVTMALPEARQVLDLYPPPRGVLYKPEFTKHDPAYVARRLGLRWPVEHEAVFLDYNRSYVLIVLEGDGVSILTPHAWRERFPSPVPEPQEQ